MLRLPRTDCTISELDEGDVAPKKDLMRLRRFILVAIFVVLGICGVGGLFAVYAPYEIIAGIVGGTFAIAVTLGLVFPLTLLIERPKYRAAGVAAVAVLLLALLFLELAILFAYIASWQYEQVLSECMLLTVLMGTPVVGALLLHQFRWARVSARTFTVVSAVALVVTAVGDLDSAFSSPFRGWYGSSNLQETGLILYVLGVGVSLLLVNVGCGDRRWFRIPAIIAAGVGFLMFIGSDWSHRFGYYFDTRIPEQISIALILPLFFFAHVNLILMAGTNGALRWLRIAAVTTSAVLLSLYMVTIFTDSFYYVGDILLAVAVVVFCESLGIVGVALLHRRTRQREVASIASLTHVDLTCPYCRRKATFPLGYSRCGGCGLQFSIQAIEPRCHECGYLLYGISSNHCPECGVAIDVAGGASAAGDSQLMAVPEKQVDVSKIAMPGT
jgi:hypothetical protein